MKYRALRVLATVYKILAWVTLAVGVIVSVSLLFGSSAISQGLGLSVSIGVGFLVALLTMGFTLLQFVFLLGFGELINLVFDIEANTRMQEKGEEEDRGMRAAA